MSVDMVESMSTETVVTSDASDTSGTVVSSTNCFVVFSVISGIISGSSA